MVTMCRSVSETSDYSLLSLTSQNEIGKLQFQDTELGPIYKYLEANKLPSDPKLSKQLVSERCQFDLVNDVLYYKNPDLPGRWRIAVPHETLLREAHDSKFAGHFAERRIYELLRRHYWWRGMRADIRKYCRLCMVCTLRSGARRALKPELQPIPVGGSFHRVGVYVLQLPLRFEGNQYAIVFMDYLSKWPEVFASPDQKAETIAKLLVEQVVARHGVPEQLLSDRGANFLSELMQEVCSLLGIKKSIHWDITPRLMASWKGLTER